MYETGFFCEFTFEVLTGDYACVYKRRNFLPLNTSSFLVLKLWYCLWVSRLTALLETVGIVLNLVVESAQQKSYHWRE